MGEHAAVGKKEGSNRMKQYHDNRRSSPAPLRFIPGRVSYKDSPALRALCDTGDHYFHGHQQSSKMLEENTRLLRLSHEMRRRSEIQRLTSSGKAVEDIKLEQLPVDCTRVSLTVQVHRSEFVELFGEGLLRHSKESLSSIMNDTSTQISVPDMHEINDLAQQVVISGKLTDVDEARRRLRLFCVLQVEFPLLESLFRPGIGLSDITEWIQTRLKDGTLAYEQLAMQLIPPNPTKNAIFKKEFQDTFMLRITGRVGDREVMAAAVTKLITLLFVDESIKKIVCCTYFDIPHSQMCLYKGDDETNRQLVNISSETNAVLHFPVNLGQESFESSFDKPSSCLYITGPIDSILLARDYLKALQPIQATFNARDTDLLYPFRDTMNFATYDNLLGLTLRVLKSEYHPVHVLPSDEAVHYFCFCANEYNVRNIFVIMKRTMRYLKDVILPLASDYDFMLPILPLLSHPSKKALLIPNRCDPRALILPTRNRNQGARVERQPSLQSTSRHESIESCGGRESADSNTNDSIEQSASETNVRDNGDTDVDQLSDATGSLDCSVASSSALNHQNPAHHDSMAPLLYQYAGMVAQAQQFLPTGGFLGGFGRQQVNPFELSFNAQQQFEGAGRQYFNNRGGGASATGGERPRNGQYTQNNQHRNGQRDRDHYRPYRYNNNNNNFNGHRGARHSGSNERRGGSGYRRVLGGHPTHGFAKAELPLKYRNPPSGDDGDTTADNLDRFYSLNESQNYVDHRRFNDSSVASKHGSGFNASHRHAVDASQAFVTPDTRSHKYRPPLLREEKEKLLLRSRSPLVGSSQESTSACDILSVSDQLRDMNIRMSADELLLQYQKFGDEPELVARNRQLKENDDSVDRGRRQMTFAEVLAKTTKDKKTTGPKGGSRNDEPDECRRDDTSPSSSNSDHGAGSRGGQRSYSSACMTATAISSSSKSNESNWSADMMPSARESASGTGASAADVEGHTRGRVDEVPPPPPGSRSSSRSSHHSSRRHHLVPPPAPKKPIVYRSPLAITVDNLLAAVNCQQYSQLFHSAKVDAAMLLRMNDPDMRCLGINSEAARRAILAATQQLRLSMSSNHFA